MLYLATPTTGRIRAAMRDGLLGQIVTPAGGNRLEPCVPWVLDNGCFSDSWSPSRWMSALDRYAGHPGCLFAVVPDVVGDAGATDDLWGRWRSAVTDRGYPAAYVTQNGCGVFPADADAVFTGGDNAWKLGPEACRLVAEAKRGGLWTHMGRVNSLRRLRFAAAHGYDSVDGTCLAFGPDVNLPRLLRYLRAAEHPTLFGGEA